MGVCPPWSFINYFNFIFSIMIQLEDELLDSSQAMARAMAAAALGEMGLRIGDNVTGEQLLIMQCSAVHLLDVIWRLVEEMGSITREDSAKVLIGYLERYRGRVSDSSVSSGGGSL